MAIKSTKPRIAVLEFKNKTDNKWWFQGAAEAVQDVFVTELVKSGKFSVMDREQLAALLQEHNLTLSGDVNPTIAVKLGKILGVNYLLAGAITQYSQEEDHSSGTLRRPSFSLGKGKFVAEMNAQFIDVSTGEISWADEAHAQEASVKVSVGGFGGGEYDARMFDKVMKPAIQQLTASLKAADI